MKDVLLIAIFALGGAAVAGLGGAAVLMFLRRRSVAVSLIVVAVVAVTAMLAGTLSVAWAMFLSPPDLWVVTLVVAMAAVVSFVTALVLGRWVVARSRDLARAARDFGDGGDFAAPAAPATAELADTGRRTGRHQREAGRLPAAREGAGGLAARTGRLDLHDLRTPLTGLRAMAEALEDGVAADPARYHRQIRAEVERLTAMVGDLFELSRIHAGAFTPVPSRMSLRDLAADALLALGRGPTNAGCGWSARTSTTCRSRSTAGR